MKIDNLTLQDIERMAFLNAPRDTQENPAYPNFTDTDIFVKGFVDGYIYCIKRLGI